MQAPMLDLLRRDGLVDAGPVEIERLTGGVSSEIYRVRQGGTVFAVKRALDKLLVADDWFADLSRNASEVDFLRVVGELRPDAVPRVLFVSKTDGYFAMEFLGDGFANWKTLLLEGLREPSHARRAAEVLAAIHGRTWDDAAVRAKFETTDNFFALRLDPYLLTTGARHSDLAPFFAAEVERIKSSRRCLVHGDYSPKNILLRDERLVVLDCEVAWFGDPTFDAAFLLNHFFLKSLHVREDRAAFFVLIETFVAAYGDRLGSERFAAVAPHLPRLLPMLMLARIDGKSPVEYLRESDSKKNLVRRFARAHIPQPPVDLEALLDAWRTILDEYEN